MGVEGGGGVYLAWYLVGWRADARRRGGVEGNIGKHSTPTRPAEVVAKYYSSASSRAGTGAEPPPPRCTHPPARRAPK